MKGDISNNHYNKENFIRYPVRLVRHLLKVSGLEKLFEKHVRDPRYEQIKYSLTSLLLVGVFVYLFRAGSKNNFYQQLYQGRSGRSLARLIGIDCDRLPDISTIDNLFLMLDPHDLIPILFDLFKWLLSRKVITYSAESPLLLAIDAYHSKTYDKCSSHGPCPYCLPRKKGDTLLYYHINVVVSVVFPDGFQLPLYVHRLKAQHSRLPLSDARFKQECELNSLEPILRTIRSYLPRVKFRLLLDALYANSTAIDLAEKYGMGYRIVLKNFKNSAKVRSSTFSKKAQHTFETNRFRIKQQFAFCQAMRGNRLINVIDLIETSMKKRSARKANVHFKRSCWQWIVNEKINEDNVVSIAQEARLRWHQEDFINTAKNRGFHIQHDLSRNAQAQSVWMILMLIAFFLSSLILHSHLGKEARKKKCSMRFFMQQMLQDLFYISPEELFDCPYPKQLRFSICPQGG